MPEQTVADIMTKIVVQMPAETTIVEAARTMRDQQIGDVVVTSGPHIAGIVTDRDIVVRGLARGIDPQTDTLERLLGHGPTLTVAEGTPLPDAAAQMRVHAVRRLLITDADGSLTGIVSLGDLAVWLAPGSVLAKISTAPANN